MLIVFQPYPLHATYLHFYSAHSNEAIARSIHNLSTAKLPALEQAKRSYQAATEALSACETVIDVEETQDFDTSSESSSTITDISSRPSTPNSSQPEPESPVECSSPSSVESSDEFTQYQRKLLEPSPLRIHKSVTFSPNPPTAQIALSPPWTPLRKAHETTAPSSDEFITPNNYSHTPYTTHLLAFTSMLTTHILTINHLTQTTQDIQAQRYTTKRLASYGEDEEAKAADRKARIVRLREGGWRRERFRPERYWAVCERALGEL